MHSKDKYYLAGFIALIIIMLAGNIFLYSSLKQDYTQQITTLNDNLKTTSAALEKSLQEEVIQREALAIQTSEKVQTLSSSIKTQETSLRSEIDAKVGKVSQDLEDTSAQLSTKISGITVGSSDFSDIIEDSIESVLSVKTAFGQGSGFIYDSQGYVMTNQHVIEGASYIIVVDSNKKSYQAKLIGVASSADLAVLKIISNKTFPALDFASDSEIKIGAKVIAVGNPLGLTLSVTEGIISAKDRIIDSSGVGYLQTDVPINPGNSGGPLINTNGNVVGVNTVKISDAEGLGFAIPSSLAKEIGQEAIDKDTN